jgi:hypothetical protein
VIRDVAPAHEPSRRWLSPRTLFGLAFLVLLAGGAAAGLAVILGGSNVPARGSLANALPGAAEVQKLFGDFPQHDNIFGNPAGRVTLVEYLDLQSPACRRFQTQVLPKLLSRYVLDGKVTVEARLTGFIGRDSDRGRGAAIAAGEQRRLFDFVQLLYENQGSANSSWLDDGMVTDAAASIPGLDVRRLRRERKAMIVVDQGRLFDDEAASDKVTATPTVFVGKTGKTLHRVVLAGPTDERSIAAAIDAALR